MILLYHRVTRLQTDPQLLAVSPANFAAHLDVLGDRAVPLADAAAGRGIGITFDDGYADNLHEAEPILQRAGAPATVFATTGRTGTAEEFFWDELDRLLLQPGTLPAAVTIVLGVLPRSFDVPARYEPSKADRRWDVTQPANPGSRQRLYLDLCGAIHRLTADARAAVLADLRRWAGVDAAGRPSHRMMTAAELRQLDGDVVQIGGHTAEHPLLAIETPDRQRAEVDPGRLSAILGRPVTTFSYPFGGRRDYTPDTVATVRDAGYTLACSNFTGRVGPDTDRSQLPRFLVRDWDGPRFAAELAAWSKL